MRTTKRSSSVALVLVALSGCKLPVDFERTSAQIPACSAEADVAFDRIVRDFLEVDASTPDFMELGVGKAERGGGWHPHTDVWYPVTGFKAPVAGPLQRVVWATDDDFDWGLDVGVAPSSSSQARLDEASERFDAVEFGNGKLPRIHCEVAPESSFPDRAGFWFTQLALMDEGKLGAFGPWVGDLNPDHDAKSAIPELHPVELTWWRQTTGPRDSIFWLLVMQDSINQYNRPETYYDSAPHRNRFRQRDYFDFDGRPEPVGWKPWAKGPIRAQYRIAFEVLANEPAAQFWIVPQVKLSVLKTPAWDMDDGATHRLIVDGREILKAAEVTDPQDTVVRVAELCQTADGAFRGFLEVSTWTGVEDPDYAGGYHFLAVIRNGGVPRQLRDRPIPTKTTVELERKKEEPKPKFEAWLEVAPTLRTDAVTCAWYQVAQTLEQPDLPPPPANLLRSISAWDVAANFEVGPEEAGRTRLEDATAEQQLASREALATAKVEWDVKLTCFDPNAKIEIREDDGSGAAGASAGTAIVVTKRAVRTPQESLRIAIPPEYASHLIHAAITASVKDARGRVAKATTDLWSSALAADRELLPHEVGRWLGIPVAERGPSALRACLLDRCADGVLTLTELRSLLRAKAKRPPAQ